MKMNGLRIICPVCKKKTAVYRPKGGDGTGVYPRAHTSALDGYTNPCTGCSMLIDVSDVFHIENLHTELKKERKLYEDEVMKIIAQVVYGESEKYFLRHTNGQKYVRWGAVERDIRAIFNEGGKK